MNLRRKEVSNRIGHTSYSLQVLPTQKTRKRRTLVSIFEYGRDLHRHLLVHPESRKKADGWVLDSKKGSGSQSSLRTSPMVSMKGGSTTR